MGNSRAHFSTRSTSLDLDPKSLDPSVLCQLLQVALMSLPGVKVRGDDQAPLTPDCSAELGEGDSCHRFPTSHWGPWLFLLFSESDSDLEPVGAGIQHLQKLSQELEEAIVAEER